jgi:TonB family protein
LRSEWIFRAALVLSVAAHGVLLASKVGDDGEVSERIVKIPILLEEEPQLLPPPPPPKPEEPRKKKPRPEKLARRIKEVVEGDGLRTGELVDAEVGEYEEEVKPEPPPPPPPPPPPKPKPKPKPEVDKVKLAREFLAELRIELMSKKRYPLAAQRMGVTGAVAVSFAVMPDSTFTGVKVKRSSGHDILDVAALDTVRRLSGKLKRPVELGDNSLRTSVVLRYELEGRGRGRGHGRGHGLGRRRGHGHGHGRGHGHGHGHWQGRRH